MLRRQRRRPFARTGRRVDTRPATPIMGAGTPACLLNQKGKPQGGHPCPPTFRVIETFWGSGGGESPLGGAHQRREGGSIAHGEVRQHLAVNLDAGLRQPVDKAAIGQALSAGSGIDTLDPEAAELPLAVPPVGVGVAQRVEDRLVGLRNRRCRTPL